jgi:hypothetical protein
MFFVFGFGKQTVKEYGKTPEQHCPRCEKMAPLIFAKVTTWFTLFFIPIIPYKTRFLLICPICNAVKEVPKEEMDRVIDSLKPLGSVDPADPEYREMPGAPQDGWSFGEATEASPARDTRDPNRFAGKNPTQKAFLEKMEAHERALEAQQSNEADFAGGETDAPDEDAESAFNDSVAPAPRRRAATLDDKRLSLDAWERELAAREKALEAREQALSAKEAKEE